MNVRSINDSFLRAIRPPMLLTVVFVLGCATAGLDVQPQRESVSLQGTTPPASSYVPGELIVKLAPEAGERLDEALKVGRPMTQTGLEWFDALAQRYGVTRIEPVFSHQTDPEAIKQKYPERAKRAPPGAQIPNLQYIYKVTMRRDTNMDQAAGDYRSRPDVEYAHPNYLATIQGGTRDRP